MKKALNAWSVEEGLSMEETFAAVAKAGFEGIELNVDAPGKSNGLSMNSTDDDYAAIRALSKKYDLPVISISTSLSAGMSGAREMHESYRKLILKQIEAAKALGATGILTATGGMNYEGVSLKMAREATVDFFKGMRDEIEATGIYVGLENVWNGFFLSPYDMVSVIDAVGSPKIGAYYDAGNVIAFSDSQDWVEVLGGRIGFVHVKNFMRRGGLNSGGEWADITEGSAKWEKIIPALRMAGFDGYLTGEVFNRRPGQSWADYYKKVADEIGTLCAM